jgi:hypothetical protein
LNADGGNPHLKYEWELLPSLCALIKEFFTFFGKLNFSSPDRKPQTVWFLDPLKVSMGKKKEDLLSILFHIKNDNYLKEDEKVKN